MEPTNEEKRTETEGIIQGIYELRSLVHACMVDAHGLSTRIARGTGGREVSLAITKLQEAKSWLSEAVNELVPRQTTTGEAHER